MEAKAMTSISIALTLAAMSTLWSAGSAAAQMTGGSAGMTAAAVDPSALDGYVGTYKSYIWTAKVGIAKNGQLTLRINDLEPVALIAESDTRFRPAGIKDTTLIFHADANGISHFILNREGKEIRANRKRPKAPRA
jgi:hypothetical protein